jgi:putative endonuclease
MNQYFVYILLCGDNSYYTGITNDIERRIWEHETCFYPTAYTSKRLPVKLVFWEKFNNPDHAIEFEKQVKGWNRKKKEALIEGNWDKLKELSVCTNGSHYSNAGFDSAQPDQNKLDNRTLMSP